MFPLGPDYQINSAHEWTKVSKVCNEFYVAKGKETHSIIIG